MQTYPQCDCYMAAWWWVGDRDAGAVHPLKRGHMQQLTHTCCLWRKCVVPEMSTPRVVCWQGYLVALKTASCSHVCNTLSSPPHSYLVIYITITLTHIHPPRSFVLSSHLQILDKISRKAASSKGRIHALCAEVVESLEVGVHHNLLFVGVLEGLDTGQGALTPCHCVDTARQPA